MSQLGNVLVIGGCGFLGHHIVDALQNRPGTTVSVFDLSVQRNRFPGISYHSGDICSRSDVSNVLEIEKPSVIIHTASPKPLMLTAMSLYERVNIEGTKNLLDCAIDCGYVRAFVYTSSASVVHDARSDMMLADETYPILRMPEQREPYSHTKGIADEMVLAANRSMTSGKGDDQYMLTCSIRPAAIFGYGDDGLVQSIAGAAKAGKGRFQIGPGNNTWDVTYVVNVAESHLLAAEALLQATRSDVPADMRVEGEAFIITNGEPVHFWTFSRAIGAAAGYPTAHADIRVVPIWLALWIAIVREWIIWLVSFGKRAPRSNRQAIAYTCMTRTYNIDKARKRLKYEPRISMEEAVSLCGKVWKQNELPAEGKKSK
jgi:sterol-4alpha-carboxylate 3-dehydrogenase (decarboxylating)